MFSFSCQCQDDTITFFANVSSIGTFAVVHALALAVLAFVVKDFFSSAAWRDFQAGQREKAEKRQKAAEEKEMAEKERKKQVLADKAKAKREREATILRRKLARLEQFPETPDAEAKAEAKARDQVVPEALELV